MSEFYPKAAQDEGLSGSATIACSVTGEGTLQRCTVTSESPEGAGFGAASLAMAPLFRMKPMTIDGQAVEGGTVQVPIQFVMPLQERTPSPDPLRFALPLGSLLVLFVLSYAVGRAWRARRAAGGRDGSTGGPGRARPGSIGAMREVFAKRFEPDGDGYLFRANLRSPGYRFTAAERDRLADEFGRRIPWLVWGGAGLTVLLILTLTLAVPERDGVAEPVLLLSLAGGMAAWFVPFHWLWNSPLRALGNRPPATAGRTRDDARRIALESLTWRQLGVALLAAAAMLWRVSAKEDVLQGWGRIWLLFAGGLVLLVAVQAIRKWRSGSDR